MWSSLIWALLIAGVVLIFRVPLYDLLSNLGKKSKIGYKGAFFEIGSSNDVNLAQGITQGKSKNSDLSKTFQSVAITQEEQFIRDQLVEKGVTQEQAIDVLINHLANTRLIATMHFIDKLIFTEQIEILEKLNSHASTMAEAELLPFFNRWRDRVKDSEYTFEKFLGFLVNNRLVSQNLAGYGISNLGKEYLIFRIRIGLTLNFTPQETIESQK